ncbi:transposase [Olivibacter sp. SDN3]|nr:transposase [Olivibacter sp. SDN3]
MNDSSIPELCGFAKGLRQDLAEIKNAFDLPWSNGPVEENVNKLKTLKRQMYGRCSLRLLEKRLVLPPS